MYVDDASLLSKLCELSTNY